MKNTILHWTSVLLASTALMLSACSSDEDTNDGPTVSPVFPDLATLTIPAGETSCEVTFTPNMDWTASIPTDAETARWFKISDGTMEDYSISGKASSTPVTLYVTTIDQETFDETPVCEVSLTMGGQTEVIARITRGNAAREFSLFASDYDTNEDDFIIPYVFSQSAMTKYTGTETSFPYENAPEGTVEMKWPTRVGEFMYVFKAQGNFEWLISTPEWINATSTAIEGENANKITLTGKFTEENIDGAVGVIDFYDASIDKDEDPGNNAHNKYCISMPAFRDIVRSRDLGATFTFNGDGYYVDTNGTVITDQKCTMEVSSTKGIQFIVITPSGNGGYYANGINWVTVTPTTEWNDAEGAFQSKSYTIDVQAYAGSRSATILALPPTVAAKIDMNGDLGNQLLDTSGSFDLKEEYKPYIFASIEQKTASQSEGFSLSYTEDVMSNYYIEQGYFNLEDLTDADPNTDPDVAENAGYIEMGAKLYRLTYGNESMSQGSLSLLLSGEFSTYMSNPFGNEWLMFMDMDDGTCMISMSGYGDAGAKGDKGNLNFYNGQDVVVAVVVCVRNY